MYTGRRRGLSVGKPELMEVESLPLQRIPETMWHDGRLWVPVSGRVKSFSPQSTKKELVADPTLRWFPPSPKRSRFQLSLRAVWALRLMLRWRLRAALRVWRWRTFSTTGQQV